jgi:hypothetical protein
MCELRFPTACKATSTISKRNPKQEHGLTKNRPPGSRSTGAADMSKAHAIGTNGPKRVVDIATGEASDREQPTPRRRSARDTRLRLARRRRTIWSHCVPRGSRIDPLPFASAAPESTARLGNPNCLRQCVHIHVGPMPASLARRDMDPVLAHVR